jgi:hypothetical protein
MGEQCSLRFSFSGAHLLIPLSARLLCARRGKPGTVGAPYLAACEGKLYWEMRVISAFPQVCFAGTSFRTGSQAPQGQEAYAGMDETGWALIAGSRRLQGSVPKPSSTPPACSSAFPGPA